MSVSLVICSFSLLLSSDELVLRNAISFVRCAGCAWWLTHPRWARLHHAWLWRWLDITERYGDSLTCPGSRCSGAEKLLGECIFLRMEVIRCWAFSSSLILASSLLGIAVFSYLFSSRLWVRKFYVMIREISLKLSKTARRGFLTFLSGGQNRLNSLSVFKVHSGIARL